MRTNRILERAVSTPNRDVLPATERSTINIPHSDLFNPDGSLRLLQTGLDRSLIQINQGVNSLQVRIGGVIGRLPITDQLSLDISPKFPISNLARLIAKSDQTLDRKVDADRLYDFSSWNGYLPELLLRSFALELAGVESEGIHRIYSRSVKTGTPRPKLDFRRSEQQFWSRGILTRAVTEVFEFSSSNAANKLIKAALINSIRLASGEPQLSAQRAQFAHALRGLNRVADLVDSNIDRATEDALLELPRFKPRHSKAVLIAREIIKRSGVILEFATKRLSLPSFIINLDKVFESYIRNSLEHSIFAVAPGWSITDGNLQGISKPLLNDNDKFIIMPDILISHPNTLIPSLVCDVKYKTKPAEEDRYQIISHCVSYQSNAALLIYPKRRGGPSGLIRLGSLGPVEYSINLYEYHFDIGENLENQEAMFSEAVVGLLTR